MQKVGSAIIRWSKDASLKIPVTVLDKVGEIRITYSSRNTLRAKFDEETGVLMMRGGPLAGDAWIPVLTNENTWYRRVREAGGLVEVLEVPPELPEEPAAPAAKRKKRVGAG
jgi:hypothetical protein